MSDSSSSLHHGLISLAGDYTLLTVRVLEPGRFRATVGGSQPDARSAELTGAAPLAIEFEVV